MEELFQQVRKETDSGRRKSEWIAFLGEVRMLCSASDGKLFSVLLKPFLQGSTLYALVVLQDVSVFNEFKALRELNANKSRMLA